MHSYHIWLYNSNKKLFFSTVVRGATHSELLEAMVLKLRARRFKGHVGKAASIVSSWVIPGTPEIAEDVTVKKNNVLLPLMCHKYNITTREAEVLEMRYTGNTLAQIAKALFISRGTIKTHLHNIYVKLDVSSTQEAIHKLT